MDEFLVLVNLERIGSTGLKATKMNHLPFSPKKIPGKSGFPRRLESLPDTVNEA